MDLLRLLVSLTFHEHKRTLKKEKRGLFADRRRGTKAWEDHGDGEKIEI